METVARDDHEAPPVVDDAEVVLSGPQLVKPAFQSA